MGNKNKTNDLFIKNSLDVPFFIIMLGLMTVGLVMLLSSSYIYAFHNTKSADSLFYFKRQILFAAIGLVMMLIVSRLNYRHIKPFINIGLFVSFILLLYTVVSGGGDGINRWIELGPINLQPSEIAKIMLILFLANGLDRDRKKIVSKAPSKAWWAVKIYEITGRRVKITSATSTMFFYLFVIGFTALLVLVGSHLSGAILIGLIGITMLWIGECDKKWFIIGGIAVAIVFVYVYFYYEDLPLKDYMIERIRAWRIKDYDPDDARWQINNSLNALGSGGLLGSGIGNSKMKYLYIPESHTDFIFAIIGEELGFVGCVLILLGYAALIVRGIYIGMRARDRFGALLAFGMASQIAIQVIFNVAVVTDTVPNTGIGLPFFSYGGSALWIILIEMGLILAVSRQADLPKVYSFKKERKTERKKG